MERFSLLRPALENGISQAEVARLHHLPLRTVQRWMQHYHKYGLVGLAKKERNDRDIRRKKFFWLIRKTLRIGKPCRRCPGVAVLPTSC